jgi:hypothetical protein
VGVKEGADAVVSGGLGRRVGQVKVGDVLGELPLRTERPVDLVGRNVDELEGVTTPGVETSQVRPRRLEQDGGTQDARFEEGLRAADRAADMGLGREVDDGRRPIFGELPRDLLSIHDFPAHEVMHRVVPDRHHGANVSGVRQLVEVEDAVGSGLDQLADEAADEAGPTGDED